MPEGNLLHHDKLLVSYKLIKFDDGKIAFFKLMIIVVVFLHILYRHPQHIDRPTFQKLCEFLQVSESGRLLKWSVRERAVDMPNALRLGTQLKLGAELHKDLQNVYKTS